MFLYIVTLHKCQVVKITKLINYLIINFFHCLAELVSASPFETPKQVRGDRNKNLLIISICVICGSDSLLFSNFLLIIFFSTKLTFFFETTKLHTKIILF